MVKIFLQRPWKVSDSSYYRYLNEGLPKGIEYINLQKNVLTSSKDFWKNKSLKKKVKSFFRNTKLPYPNAHFTKNSKKYDLIHCAHCLSLNKTKPWICDIEYEGQFYIGNKSKILKNIVGKILKRKNCRKIMPWTKWSKDNILRDFPELKDKIELVYPALPLRKVDERNYDKINLLFIGREFLGKGGEIALEVMDYLTKKHSNVYGTVITEIIEKNIEKYRKNNKIKILDLVSQEKLFEEIYPQSDIFIYPTRSDTLGFAILEAQSFGIPVIVTKTTSTHTVEETIDEGRTGFIVPGNYNAWTEDNEEKKRIIKEIIGKSEELIENKKLLSKMSENCFKEFDEGKFSIRERNKKLEKIFKEIFNDR